MSTYCKHWRTVHPSKVRVGDMVRLQRLTNSEEVVTKIRRPVDGMYWFETKDWHIGRRSKVRALLQKTT